MAVQLLRYLLREEYTKNDICILTAYREQLNELESVSITLFTFLVIEPKSVTNETFFDRIASCTQS